MCRFGQKRGLEDLLQASEIKFYWVNLSIDNEKKKTIQQILPNGTIFLNVYLCTFLYFDRWQNALSTQVLQEMSRILKGVLWNFKIKIYWGVENRKIYVKSKRTKNISK